MPGIRYDIQTVKGDMLEVIFQYVDPTGAPIDLSDCYAIMMMRAEPTDPDPQISLDSRNVGGGILFVETTSGTYGIDPTQGNVFVKVTRSQAEATVVPGGWYQVKLFSFIDADFEDTLAFGKYEIFPEVAYD